MGCPPVLRCSSTEVSKCITITQGSPELTRSLGEFYGHNLSTSNLEMIARFFEKYPEFVDRTFLSIKVGKESSKPPLPTR